MNYETGDFELNVEKNSLSFVFWSVGILISIQVLGICAVFLTKPNLSIFMFSILHLLLGDNYGRLLMLLKFIWLPLEIFPYIFGWTIVLMGFFHVIASLECT